MDYTSHMEAWTKWQPLCSFHFLWKYFNCDANFTWSCRHAASLGHNELNLLLRFILINLLRLWLCLDTQKVYSRVQTNHYNIILHVSWRLSSRTNINYALLRINTYILQDFAEWSSYFSIFVRIEEAGGLSYVSTATSSTDTVHVFLDAGWHVVVDNMFHPWDVQTTGSHGCGYEDRCSPSFEISQSLFTLPLLAITEIEKQVCTNSAGWIKFNGYRIQGWGITIKTNFLCSTIFPIFCLCQNSYGTAYGTNNNDQSVTNQSYTITLEKCSNQHRNFQCIWVRSQNCGCLVTWFCYQLIAKPGNKTAAVSWPDPYENDHNDGVFTWREFLSDKCNEPY